MTMKDDNGRILELTRNDWLLVKNAMAMEFVNDDTTQWGTKTDS